jgi:hypothetical protein
MNPPPTVIHQSYEALSGVGTVGWLVLLIGYPLIRGRFSEAFVWILFSMVIIDIWATLPANLHEDRPDFPQQFLIVWAAAIAPWVIFVGRALWDLYTGRVKAAPKPDSMVTFSDQ